jgi:hypothetical protein
MTQAYKLLVKAKQMATLIAKVLLFLTGKTFLRNCLDYNQEQVLSVSKKRAVNLIKRL